MDHICLALPIVNGQTAAARAFLKQLDTTRRAEFDESERRIGITKELWYLATLPSGDHLVAYMEAPDFGHALAAQTLVHPQGGRSGRGVGPRGSAAEKERA